jgi:hypothetical protein
MPAVQPTRTIRAATSISTIEQKAYPTTPAQLTGALPATPAKETVTTIVDGSAPGIAQLANPLLLTVIDCPIPESPQLALLRTFVVPSL